MLEHQLIPFRITVDIVRHFIFRIGQVHGYVSLFW